MKILKIFFITSCLIFLSGCFQTTSLLGPGVTVATSGNVFQAGLQYGANTALKNETGKDFISHIKDKVEERNNEKKLHVKLKQLLEKRIETTRQMFLSN
tara:strand:+ start:222 stop:518 length:297 start_codon:yes stop_codon:yes gene_type:complete